MIQFETYHLNDSTIDKSVHGYDGPINVSFGTHAPKGPQDDIIAAAKATGEGEIVDLQDFKSCGAYSVSPLSLSEAELLQTIAFLHDTELLISVGLATFLLMDNVRTLRIGMHKLETE